MAWVSYGYGYGNGSAMGMSMKSKGIRGVAASDFSLQQGYEKYPTSDQSDVHAKIV